MELGPELVVPNVTYDGPAHLVYAFPGGNDDDGITYTPAEPITAGDYAYSFECLTFSGDMPMNVRICGEGEYEGGYIRGATEPGPFSGIITVTDRAAAEQNQAILLNVTGGPDNAGTARNLSVRRIIG